MKTTRQVSGGGLTTALDAQITAADIATAGSASVTVYSSGPGGGTSAGASFTIGPGGPVVTSVSPNPVTGANTAQTLTVTGSGFVNGAQVRLRCPAFSVDATKSATFDSASQLRVSATFGTDPAAWTAQVINPGGAASGQYSFTVQAPSPVIDSLSPSSATAGGSAFTLRVNGNTFHNSSVVRWNGGNRTTTPVVSAGGLTTALDAQIPAADIASAGSASVTVYTSGPGGGISVGATFTINAGGPIVSGVSPNPVTGANIAQTLTVTGSGFVNGAQVRLRCPAFSVDATKSATFDSSSQLRVSATFGTDPASWTAQAINPGGAASGQLSFTVQAPVPVIQSLSPSSVTAGGAAFTLRVNGSTFHNSSVVRWNGGNRTTTPVVSAGGLTTALDAQITAADIASAGSATVTVYSPGPGGGTSAGATFTVPTPVLNGFLIFPIVGLSQTSANVSAVFDHMMTAANTPGTGVIAYDGEVGTIKDTSWSTDGGHGLLYGYKKTDGSAVSLPLGHYTGGSTLFYEGHTGYDFPYDHSHEVVAAAGGIVHKEDDASNQIWIDHGNGYSTWYLHMLPADTAALVEGATVTQGQHLGYCGNYYNTAGGVGYHLHFTVKKGSDRVDPYGWSGSGEDPYYTRFGVRNEVLWSATAPVPTITSVSPTSMPASSANQPFTINGSNFDPAATLTVDPPTGSNIESTEAKFTSKSATRLVYQLNNGSDIGTWQVRVNNPGGVSSAWASFMVTDGGTPVQLTGVPYVHQLYDTPDEFGGGSYACNASAALMAIQYYNKLPAHPITCTRGGTHTSQYGFYVPSIYSYNGHTFNTPSSSVWGASLAGYYGGFGYFLQDAAGDSLQRSSRLSEYIAHHGLTSSVDNDVSGETGFSKVCSEIDAGHPVILLTSLTTEGHYVTCIGYVAGQHTLIFNDSYGDKQAGYPNASGAAVRYDWPGWDQGHPNLTTVHRIIYARPPTCTATLVSPAAGATVAAPPTFKWTFTGSCSTKVYVATDPVPDRIAVFKDVFSAGANTFTPSAIRWSSAVAYLGAAQTYYWTIGNADTSQLDTYAAWRPFVAMPILTGGGGGGLEPPSSSGQFRFEVTAPNQLQVTVQASDDLAHWTDIGTSNIVNGKTTFTDPSAGAHTKRFYRPKP
ncbi:MAG TPA: peptidoglycan DD-metalloendopeptidase family protein [Verrucomicrobiae bacterium]